MARCGPFCDKFNRLKTLNDDMLSTPLNRCLTTLDLTLLGIGYMIGPGIYVVTGTVIRYEAGDGAIFSYLVAGLAATLASLCYAEFGSKIPLAGSAYTYTYVTMGEFWAFVVGWNMLLEYVIMVASSAKAWSSTLDAGLNFTISHAMVRTFGSINIVGIGQYPDFVAVAIVLVCMAFVVSGAKSSVMFNNILAFLVLVSILLITGLGFDKADTQLWTNSTYGGFLPYGVKGVFRGAATCFYSYIGFDGIAVAGEEAIDPKRALPWATSISMTVVTVLYVLATMALTLITTYKNVSVTAPYPAAFQMLGIAWAKYAVVVGSLIGITTSISGGMFFVPRIAYSMASDGLLFPIFGKIWTKTQTPAWGILILGLVAALLAMFIELTVLVLLMSVGTLISFSFVAASVIVVRYRVTERDSALSQAKEDIVKIQTKQETDQLTTATPTESAEAPNGSWRTRNGTLLVIPGPSCFGLRDLLLSSKPYRDLGQEKFVILIILFVLCNIVGFLLTLIFAIKELRVASWWPLLLCVVFASGIVCGTVCISLMTQRVYSNTFKVPFVPVLPVISVFCNLGMILMLDYLTWIRLLVWMILGCILYTFYSYKHSKENTPISHDEPVTYGTITHGTITHDTITDRTCEASLMNTDNQGCVQHRKTPQ